MRTFTLSHLSDDVLMGNLTTLVAREQGTTATLLAHLAEVDSRRLFAPAGFPSMYAWCVESLHLSEDAAYKRIQAARIARKFPALFDALADGRIHMTAVLVLAPHLTSGNVDQLIELATHRTRAEIELALARRFPRPEIQRLDDGISPLARVAAAELAPERVDLVGQLAPERVATPPTRIAPLSPERFALQVTIGQATHDKLRYAQSLLGVASGDVAPVLERALDALIGQLETQKLGSTKRPLRKPRPSAGRRTVPAQVRREVWERDRGQCTFMGKNGRLCAARKFLEFDHVDPVARGGRASVDRIRLRCRAHNQYEAERTFGAGFMEEKRRQSEPDLTADVIAGLRGLGVRMEDARRAARQTETAHDGSMENRLRAALKILAPKTSRIAGSQRATELSVT